MRRTPVLTLLAGAAVAAVLVVMSSIASSRSSTKTPNAVAATTAAAVASAQPSATPSPTPAAKVNAVWAGEVDGGGATIAISVKDGVAIAYLCDGNKTEAWLLGTAEAGKLTLNSKDGSSLTGTFGGGKATGTVVTGNKKWTFTAPAAIPPGGLYRAAQEVSNAKVVCGWIVLPDGRQVGICSADGKQAAPAPRLDVTTATPVNPKDPS